MPIFFSIFFLAAVWGAFFVLRGGAVQGIPELPLRIPLFATALIVGGFGGYFILKKLKAKAAAKALDKTLNEQADAQEQGSDPSQQPQIREMRAEFDKAVGSLKSSRLGRSGADALSALPWYVIIGPPGTGKSTALRSSGLKFPYLTKKGGVRGVGGTRNCDWWLTNEGVLLDTAGRYMTEDDDQDEWLSFLDAVAKARPRRPINGLLVTVAAPDLLAADEQGAAELGQQLRERVDEVTGRLHLVVPVYLLVTKCDLLAGFVETFGNLAKSERGQIWGLTVPVGTSHPDGPGQLVREKVDELTSVLEERALGRLAQERRMESRERILRFPRQLAALRANLGEVVQALFSENPYQDTPLLRGVYFTSGTQEGRPIDKVMAAMAQAFGIKSALPAATEPATDSRSYFLTSLFNEIIFKDRKLAVRSSAALQRQKRTRYVYAGVAAALSVALVLLPLLAFGSMRGQSAALAQAVKEVSNVSYPSDRLARLDALRQQLQEMREQESSAVGGLWTFGMNRRAQLLDAALPVYGHWVRELVVLEVAASDEKELAKLPEPGERAPLAPPPPQPQPDRRRRRRGRGRGSAPISASVPAAAPEALDQDATFERLKRHMLLSLQPTDPPATNEELFESELQSLVPRLADDYKDQASVSTDSAVIRQQLALLFELWPKHRDQWKLERKDELRRKGQAALADMDRTRRLLEQKMREWSKGKPDLTLASMVRDVSVYETSQVVRAAFTKEVWEAHVRAALENPPSDDEAWILGMKPSDTQLKEELQREYYLQYIREWTRFLGSIELRTVREPNDVTRRLESLTDSESPLKALFGAISKNVWLATPKPGEQPVVPDERTISATFFPLLRVDSGWLQKAVAKLGPAGRPTMDLDTYVGRLKEFLKAVSAAQDPAAAAGVAKTLRAEAGNMRSSIAAASQGEVYESVLQQLWVRPIFKMADALDAQTRQKLNYDWCDAVFSVHRAELRGRFPFSRAGTDANLPSVVELYGGKGKLAQFYKDNLASKIGNDGREFRRMGGEMVQESLLEYLNRAKTLSDALFPNDSPDPLVEFAVVLHPPALPSVLGVNFFVDGQQARQDTGPSEGPQRLRWPGAGKEKGAYITIARKGGAPVRIDCRDCNGTWGFFRFLAEGRVEKKSARTFTMSWLADIGGQSVPVKVDFVWDRSVSPFYGREGWGSGSFLSVFKDVEPPAAIVPGVEPCR